MIRKAKFEDAEAIRLLIAFHAENGFMLARSLEDIQKNHQDFFVYEECGTIRGTCGLNYSWEGVVEIRSLAVHPMCFGRGIATELVRKVIEDAETSEKHTLFVLTYVDKLFSRLGFDVVERDSLPSKVWNDCRGCHKRDNCDEIAMIRPLRPVAQVALADDFSGNENLATNL